MFGWNDFSSSISSGWKEVSGVVSHIGHTVVPPVVHTIGNIAPVLHKDLTGVVNFTGQQINKITDLPKDTLHTMSNVETNLINKGSDTLNNVSKNLSMPLVIGGVAVLVILLSKK